MRTCFAMVGFLLCVSAQCAESTARPPSNDEVLRILSGASPEALVNVLVTPSRHRKGDWVARADTPAKPSAIAGLCEAKRVLAVLAPSASGGQRWISKDLFHARAVSFLDAAMSCEQIAAADFFEVTELVRLEDLRIIRKAVEQIYPCVRQRACDVRLLGTPWAILDAIADSPHVPRMGTVDYEPNMSTPSSAIYDVALAFSVPRPGYHAIVTVSNGNIVQVQIVEVVP